MRDTAPANLGLNLHSIFFFQTVQAVMGYRGRNWLQWSPLPVAFHSLDLQMLTAMSSELHEFKATSAADAVSPENTRE